MREADDPNKNTKNVQYIKALTKVMKIGYIKNLEMNVDQIAGLDFGFFIEIINHQDLENDRWEAA